MKESELAAEFREALMARNRAQHDYDQAVASIAQLKTEAREKREVLTAAEKTVREIEHQLLTGVHPLPLLAAADRNGATGPDPPAASLLTANGRSVLGDASGWHEVIRPENAPADLAAAMEERFGDDDTLRDLEAKQATDAGPMDEKQALRRALEMDEVRDRLASVKAGGATDTQILSILLGWPTFRASYPPPGVPWGTSSIGFFCGHAAGEGNWPHRNPSLEGAALVKAVRRELKIPQPKGAVTTAKLRGKEAAALAMSEFDDASEDVIARARSAREAKATFAAEPPVDLTCEDLGHKPPWTDGELDRLLVFAIRDYNKLMRGFWDGEEPVSDEQIQHFLATWWPHSRVFIGPDRTGQKHGFTIQRTPLRFWVGPYLGPNHTPTLTGPELIARVRRVMATDAPSAAEEVALKIPPQRPSGAGPLRGFRECTASEWVLAGPERRHAAWRLIRDEPEKPKRKRKGAAHASTT